MGVIVLPGQKILQGDFARVRGLHHVEYFVLDILECDRLLSVNCHFFLDRL